MIHALFDERRRLEIRDGLRRGKLASLLKKPAPDTMAGPDSPARRWMENMLSKPPGCSGMTISPENMREVNRKLARLIAKDELRAGKKIGEDAK